MRPPSGDQSGSPASRSGEESWCNPVPSESTIPRGVSVSFQNAVSSVRWTSVGSGADHRGRAGGRRWSWCWWQCRSRRPRRSQGSLAGSNGPPSTITAKDRPSGDHAGSHMPRQSATGRGVDRVGAAVGLGDPRPRPHSRRSPGGRTRGAGRRAKVGMTLTPSDVGQDPVLVGPIGVEQEDLPAAVAVALAGHPGVGREGEPLDVGVDDVGVGACPPTGHVVQRVDSNAPVATTAPMRVASFTAARDSTVR